MPRTHERAGSPTQVEVRQATSNDLDALTSLSREIFGAEARDAFTFRQLLDIADPLVFVADLRGRPVGYAFVAPTWDARSAWLITLAVAPDCRRRGIGRTLMEAVIRDSIALRVSEIKLTVEHDNRDAKRLYSNLGFTAEANRADYFGPGEDRLVMRLSL
ncbi:GNAT family N-acetyltransferase [Nocardia thraciensis]